MTKALDKIGAFLLRWRISKKTLAIILVILFVVSLIPIIITAFYSVPVLDDYTFGREVHLNYVHGDSLLAGIYQTFANHYFGSAGGSYSAYFIASCQPYVFDVHLYFISNLVVIFSCIISLFYFAKVILIDVFKTTKSDYILISIPIVTLFIQLIPSAAEGFYWMDGSLTLFFNSLFLFLISVIVKFHITNKTVGKVFYSVLSILLAIVISGITPFNFVAYFLLFICSLFYCIPRKYTVYKLQIAVFCVLLAGLVLVIIAPGAAAKSELYHGMPIYKAIIYALGYSVFALGQWMTLLFISVLAFVSIVFYNIAKSSRFSFKNPLLVFIICYIIFAARFSVSFYAKGGSGAARQQNIYYFAFIVLMSVSWLYFVGWFSKRKEVLSNCSSANKRISVVLVLIIALFSIAGIIGRGVSNGVTTVSTAASLIRGQTQTYHTEMMQRIEAYEDESKTIVIVEPLSVYPSFYMDENLDFDETYWTNCAIAMYYEKEKIILVESEK